MQLVLLIAVRFARSLRSSGFGRFTSAVTIGSIGIGTIAVVCSVSVLNGYEEAIETSSMQFVSHVEVKAPTGMQFTDATAMAQTLERLDNVKNVQLMLSREVLVRTRTGVDGGILMGLDNERIASHIAPLLITGSQWNNGTVLIGEGLSLSLGVGVADTILVYTANVDASNAVIRQVVIGGIIRSGMARFDDAVLVMTRTGVAALLGAPTNSASAIAVTCNEADSASAVATRIRDAGGAGLLVSTYLDTFHAMASWIELQKRPIPIVLGLIVLVAVFTVVSTMLVAIVEKTRSVAVLVTMGLKPSRIMVIFLTQSLSLAAIGSGIGMGVSLLLLWVQRTWQVISLDGAVYYVQALPVSLSVEPFIVVGVITVCLAAVMSIIPMTIAVRIKPSAALRFS